MRIVKGGLIVNRFDRNNFIVKDAGVGVKINELLVKITKKSLATILNTYGIPTKKSDPKKFLETKLETLYKQNFPVNFKPADIKPERVKPKPRRQFSQPDVSL